MTKILSLLFFFTTIWMFSQETTKVSFEFKKVGLEFVLEDVEDAFNVSFSYLDENVVGTYISVKKANYSFLEITTEIERLTLLKIKKHTTGIYLIVKAGTGATSNAVCLTTEICPFPTELLKNVIVKSYLTRGISKNLDNSFTIIPLKLAILPGLTEPDVLKTIQQLPGVKSPNETATGLYVRGGTGDQNLVQWDGIKMYHSGHLFGMISGFNPNIKQKIHFYNKGTNPRFGDKIASVIDIQTDSDIPHKTQVSIGSNALSADIYVNQPLVKDKLNIQLSGRRSFTDLYQSPTFIKYSEKVFQNSRVRATAARGAEKAVESTTNNFFYQDYNAKVNYHYSTNSHFYFSGIFIDSDLNNDLKNTDLATLTNDKLDINNTGYSLNWKKKWNANFSSEIKAYYSQYKLNYYNNKTFLTKEPSEFFTKKNRILDSGMGLETNYKVDEKSALTSGYQLSGNHVQHLYQAGTQELNVRLDAKDAIVNTHSFYSTYYYTMPNTIHLLAGFRYNYYANLKEASLEPRVLLNISLSNKLSATISGEFKSQTISQINETVISELGLENQLWILSDASDFPIIKAKQTTAGLTYKHNRWTVDLDSYYKRTTGITSLALGFLNIMDTNSFHKGESFSKGIDLYIKKDLKNFRAWGTYSYNSVENKFEGVNENELFPSSSEIKHALNFSMAYKMKKMQFALGWYWNTGKPYTLAKEMYEHDVPYWDYDGVNTENLPNYHRLDFSAMYHFDLSKRNGVKAKTGIAFYNLYNKDNVLNIEYHTDNIPGGGIARVERHSLGFTPNLFFRVSF